MIDELPENRIPLYLVGEWIATEGGTRDLGPPMVTIENKEVPDYRFSSEGSPVHAAAWDVALEKLKAAILAERLIVEGQQDGDERNSFETILPKEFGGRFDNPFRYDSIDMILEDVRHLDFDEHRCGIIRSLRKVYWSNICARSRADVLKLWPAPSKVALRTCSDSEARDLIRAAIAASGGFISQDNGAKIVLKEFPGFSRERARELVKDLTKNSKPGPKGPRKKCAK